MLQTATLLTLGTLQLNRLYGPRLHSPVKSFQHNTPVQSMHMSASTG